MEPMREWFCKGAVMTSPTEDEAAEYQLEEYPLMSANTMTTLGKRGGHSSKGPHHPLPTDFNGRSLICASVVG